MTIPYTYYLYHKPTGKKYYGVRHKKGCNPSDLWNKYFSSSKEVKKLIEEYGINSFEYKIRKIFNNSNDAIQWEHKVLTKLKVVENDKWLNKTYGKCPTTKGYKHTKETKKKMSIAQSGENNPMFGKTHTIEAREKIGKASEGNKNSFGKKLSEEHKQKISKSSIGKKMSPESIEKIKKARAKQIFSEETKEKMRQSRLNYIKNKGL